MRLMRLMRLMGRMGLRNGFKSLEVAANIANKPFGQKSIAVAVDPAKLRFRRQPVS
jgi:hypothetical protein